MTVTVTHRMHHTTCTSSRASGQAWLTANGACVNVNATARKTTMTVCVRLGQSVCVHWPTHFTPLVWHVFQWPLLLALGNMHHTSPQHARSHLCAAGRHRMLARAIKQRSRDKHERFTDSRPRTRDCARPTHSASALASCTLTGSHGARETAHLHSAASVWACMCG